VGVDIAASDIDSKHIGAILQKYFEVFSGVGKLKEQAIQLHINR